MPEREKSINSYAAKFAVRKGLTSQHQQQVKEPEVHDNNIEQWNSVAESNTFQAQLSDQSQSHIGHNARLDLNSTYIVFLAFPSRKRRRGSSKIHTVLVQ